MWRGGARSDHPRCTVHSMLLVAPRNEVTGEGRGVLTVHRHAGRPVRKGIALTLGLIRSTHRRSLAIAFLNVFIGERKSSYLRSNDFFQGWGELRRVAALRGGPAALLAASAAPRSAYSPINREKFSRTGGMRDARSIVSPSGRS